MISSNKFKFEDNIDNDMLELDTIINRQNIKSKKTIAMCSVWESEDKQESNIFSSTLETFEKSSDSETSEDDFLKKLVSEQSQIKDSKNKRKTSSNKYKCKLCSKTYSMKKTLKIHMKFHDDPNIFKCNVCDKRYKSRQGLYYHKINKHSLSSNNLTSSNNNTLSKKEDNNDILGLSMYNGDSETSDDELLQNKEKSEYKCKLCDKKYSYKKGLKQHMKWHKNPEIFKCEICNKKYQCYSSFKYHKMKHIDINSFNCLLCDKKYKSYSGMRYHYMAEHNYKSIVFDKENKKFIPKNSNLSKSKKRKKYDNRNKKLLLKKSKKSKKNYKCDICEKSYSYKDGLKKHKINVHVNNRHYECNLCYKIFTTQQQLNYHMKWHDNPNIYKCHECDIVYNSIYGLNKHKNKNNYHSH